MSDYPGVETGPNFAVREGRSTLVPYTCFKLKADGIPLNIPEIVVGPCAEPKRAGQAAMISALKYIPAINAQSRAIRLSAVPHRNW